MWALSREAARVVVLDDRDRVLLLRARDPAEPAKGEWWEIPGGGIEAGESSAAAATRELYEETGIRHAEVGPAVWQHRARYTFAGIRFDQLEHIHVARLTGPADTGGGYRPGGLEALEALAFSGSEWWEVDGLRDLVAGGGRVLPPWLVDQLGAYLRDGPADGPRYLGELPDLF
ncbi:MAG TPA: NUDIX domain-containing protein [Acidimicrobiales bacterium]|nr:NUDIX domain-containing protein [Acidimicrobiales bacterium]